MLKISHFSLRRLKYRSNGISHLEFGGNMAGVVTYNKTNVRFLVAIWGVIVLAVLISGVSFYRHQKRVQMERVETELKTIADLKASQIAEWRKERLGDAAVMMNSVFFVDAVERWIKEPTAADKVEIHSRLESMVESYHYEDIIIVDIEGRARYRLKDSNAPLPVIEIQAIKMAARLRKPILTEIHIDGDDPTPHLEVIAPFICNHSKAGHVFAAAILQIDAEEFLYPLIQKWPTKSRSAETLLVRKDGDKALFINNLRYRKTSALKLRIPMTDREVPGIMCLKGKRGFVKGLDYRGVEVAAVLTGIPSSTWCMVSKVDSAEAFSHWRDSSVLILTLIVVLLVASTAMISAVWQMSANAHYQDILSAREAQLKLMSEREAAELERKKTTAELVESEARLRKAQEISHLGSWEFNIIKNTLYWSDEVYRIFGLQPQEFAATYEAFIETVHPDDRALVDSSYSDSVNAGKDGYEIEHRIVRKRTGEVRYVHEKCEHFRDETGNIIKSIGMVLDITERRNNEESIQELMKNLMEKNADLEAFTYTISHDLKSPIVTINGFAQALLEDAGDILDDDCKMYLNRIMSASDRMADQITALLEYTRIGLSDQRITVNEFNQLAEESVNSLIGRAKNAGVNVVIKQCDARIRGNSSLISQVFDNLIGNAIKYMNEDNPSPEVEVGAVVNGSQAACYVKDNGPGIAPEYHEKIFGVFQRVPGSSSKEGTGIGLATVKRIVEKHSGRIWIESEPGKGSVFYFTLPLGN